MLYHAFTLYPALGQILTQKLPTVMLAFQGQECYLHFMEEENGSERLSHLSETTRLARGRARIWHQPASLWNPAFSSLSCGCMGMESESRAIRGKQASVPR